MNYLTAMEILREWNISSRMAAYYCKMGRAEGIIKRVRPGLSWLVPKSLLTKVIPEERKEL